MNVFCLVAWRLISSCEEERWKSRGIKGEMLLVFINDVHAAHGEVGEAEGEMIQRVEVVSKEDEVL